MVTTILVCLALQQQISTTPKPIDGQNQTHVAAASTPTVAMLPWVTRAGTDGARDTAAKYINAVFEKANYTVLPTTGTKKIWEEDLHQSRLIISPETDGDYKPLPSPKDLLALGVAMHADLVCAGRAKWHTRSIWVSLGPKTKSDCTVDVLLVDVKKREVVLDAQNVKADDTKSESSLETAGALLVTMGITALSGGPADPHERKAAGNALAKAFGPWLQNSTRKIN